MYTRAHSPSHTRVHTYTHPHPYALMYTRAHTRAQRHTGTDTLVRTHEDDTVRTHYGVVEYPSSPEERWGYLSAQAPPVGARRDSPSRAIFSAPWCRLRVGILPPKPKRVGGSLRLHVSGTTTCTSPVFGPDTRVRYPGPGRRANVPTSLKDPPVG